MKYYYLAFLFFILFHYSFAGDNQLFFQNIEANGDVHSNTVLSIVQDRHDVMWFATLDGLNKYDGYSFKTYRNDSQNDFSLGSNSTKCLFIDSQERLWVGTNKGISKYIEEKDGFENFIVDTFSFGIKVNDIIEKSSYELLVATDNGVFVFDSKKNEFKNSALAGTESKDILSMTKIHDGFMFGSTNGLYHYNESQSELKSVKTDIRGYPVQSMLYHKENELWIATEGAGLYLFNYITREVVKHYQSYDGGDKSICSNYIRTLMMYDENQLWVGTFNGLSLLNISSGTFSNYYHDPFDNSSISHNSIRSFLKDRQGGVWLGTYYGGVNYFHPLKNQFVHLQQLQNRNSLNDNIVSSIVEDEETGCIWIGTNDNGLNIYNPITGVFDFVNKENTPGFKSNNIKTILFSPDGRRVLIGSHSGGLIIMDKHTHKILDHYLPSHDVYSLTYDSNETLWIATLSGLYYMHKENVKPELYELRNLQTQHFVYVYTDSENRLWIGGDKMLFSLLIDDNELTDFSSYFNDVKINSIQGDSKKNIWIGTDGGLYRYSNSGFLRITEREGLSNNRTYGIVEDSNGFLWISTSYGLNRLSSEELSFRTYLSAEGLPFHQFNNYSFCKTKSGRLYFGGINGIIAFIPENLKNNPYSSKPIFTDLNVQNEIVSPSEKGVLTHNIISADKITLRADKATFSLKFAVPNYLSGMHNVFMFKLEGFDKEWTITTDNHYASYANLPPGKYRMVLKSANNEGVWSTQQASLKVIVMPMWFQSIWFKVLLTIVFIAMVIAAYRFLLQREQMRRQLINERLEREKNEEINQSKLSFFVNISHEFRTPLTLIISPIDELAQVMSSDREKKLLKVAKTNAEKLLNLTKQLIDYRRAEMGVLELKVNLINPIPIIHKTMSQFETIAASLNVNYSFEDYTSGGEYLIDDNYLSSILSNLLSNAFKFTPALGAISVSLIEDLQYLILEVSDTGCGLTAKQQEKIFDRFYKVNNDGGDIGIGVGLSLTKRLVESHHGKISVKSVVDGGTTFAVYFPQNENVYSEFELKKNNNLVLSELPAEYEQTDSIDFSENTKHSLLIVEDDLELLEYMKYVLSEFYFVNTASNGQEALDFLHENPVDVILSDVMMDQVDGLSLCRIVKEDIRVSHIPVILLTAKSTVDDQLIGLRAGADDYLTKPFRMSVLKAKINNLISSKGRLLKYYSSSYDIIPEEIATNKLDNEFLSKAKEIVMNNLDNSSFTTEMFCEELGMSRTSLHLKLKALTGKSAIDFIRKIRFNEALKLLASGEYNVSEVCYMIGFNSLSYFSTSFKKHFGYLPSEHLKKLSENQNLKQNEQN